METTSPFRYLQAREHHPLTPSVLSAGLLCADGLPRSQDLQSEGRGTSDP